MDRLFVSLAQFDKAWAAMGLGDEELWVLEEYLQEHPDAGDVIPGLGGARKIRIPMSGRGKSGGGRVIYVDVIVSARIYLITAYAKNVQAGLTPDQKKQLRKLVEYIKEEG